MKDSRSICDQVRAHQKDRSEDKYHRREEAISSSCLFVRNVKLTRCNCKQGIEISEKNGFLNLQDDRREFDENICPKE